ncbi:MAG: cAMP phosphodiesterase, partial [Prochlorococcaceae cyanobacterium ETNP2_MAG_10]|nr:cAMP phosphodiesterase [Prochlorococcaceae cyanobacterium ETNP2_MAG_10]
MQTLFRRLRPVLAVTIFLAPLTLIGPAAFAQAAADADKNPATNADILLYRAIGSSYVCNARTAGVDFPKAVGIAAATYAQLINGRHGGFVASAGTEKLTTKQL